MKGKILANVNHPLGNNLSVLQRREEKKSEGKVKTLGSARVGKKRLKQPTLKTFPNFKTENLFKDTNLDVGCSEDHVLVITLFQ
jgi:hypothetical protein